MLIVPLSPDLRLGHKPVVTVCVTVLCFVLHVFHMESKKGIEAAAAAYCAELSDPWLGTTSAELLESGMDDCEATLTILYGRGDREFITELLEEARPAFEQQEFAEELELALEHYDAFSATAPWSMRAAMIYYPEVPNPVRMLTSSFLHADWGHVLFNMIFFLAFGTALEVIVGSALLFIGIMTTISIVSGVSYSLYTFLFGDPLPSLGFSDVVMGMIGLSAYLMPRTRIRTFVWIGFWAWILYIPAWIFAIWYIGKDIYHLFTEGLAGGTNLVAHVAGALTGYYLGRLWLAERKWLVETELEDEIEHMKASRLDWFGISSLRVDGGTGKRLKAAEELRAHEAEFDEALREAHKLNETHRYDEALTVLLNGITRYGESEEVYKDVFDTVWKWKRALFTLNFARHCVSYLIDHGKHKDALDVCERCFTFAPEFILARPLDVMPLARMALEQQRYQLVHSLVFNAVDRYGDTINVIDARLLEAQMLAHYLERPEAAHAILETLEQGDDPHRRDEVLALNAAIAPLLGH